MTNSHDAELAALETAVTELVQTVDEANKAAAERTKQRSAWVRKSEVHGSADY